MKLSSILYLNEQIRTAEEAISKGIAAVRVEDAAATKRVVLLSASRFTNLLRRSQALEHDLDRFIGSNAVVGVVGYSWITYKTDLYEVVFSAGVNRFGPLAYQMVMYCVAPHGWLKSDSSLTDQSQTVWNKMYELTEKGVYERKWLGDFNEDFVYKARDVSDQAMKDFSDLWDAGEEPTEASFLEYCKAKNINPASYGHFYAYRKIAHDPKIKELFDKGHELLDKVSTDFDIPLHTIEHWVVRGAGKFFQRRYF